MRKSGRVRWVVFFAVKFAAFVPVCLVAWWLFLPIYAQCLGLVASAILKYIVNVPVESFRVSNTGITNPSGILNTGTQLIFGLQDGVERTLPGLGAVVANIASFTALVLATTGLGVGRRARILATGLAILIGTHVAFILFVFLMESAEISMAIGQLLVTLPFLLWIVLAYWDKLSAYLVDTDQATPGQSPQDRPPNE